MKMKVMFLLDTKYTKYENKIHYNQSDDYLNQPCFLHKQR